MNFFRFALLAAMVVWNGHRFVAAQPIDEQFDLWPVQLKINGTVIAGGGGTMPADAVDFFLEIARQEGAKPVIVGWEAAKVTIGNDFAESIKAIPGSQVITVSTEEEVVSSDKIKSISNSKAIWIQAEGKLNEPQARLLIQILASASCAVEKGATICVNGPTAEWIGRFQPVSQTNLRTIQDAANLIPDTVILGSYVDPIRRGQLLSILAANPRCVGIGIEENTAIVLRGRQIRVLGDGVATFCLMANEHLPLRVQHVKRAPTRRANPYETIVDLTAWRRDAIERTVAPFPEAQPPLPVVEHGTLMIVGGGGMPDGLMERMVELAGGENARMVYVPCSEDDKISGPLAMVEQWKKMGVESATFVHTKSRTQANSDDAFLAPLKNATGIWFGGGRQWNLSDSYYGTQAHRLMKQVLERGGVIGGSSAGASIQARYMCRANPVANFDIMAPGYERGLGFISGVAIDQHFSQRGRQKDMTQLVNRYPQLLGIGLDEATAILVQKSRAEVLGRGKVHFYDRSQPLIPGQDDFLALESGSIFDLAERQLVEPDIAPQNGR